MTAVRATRMELLARRRQLALARQGEDLLEQKRAALVRELMRIVQVALQENTELERIAAAALNALGLASGLDGPELVHAAALAAARGPHKLEVVVEGATVMGVPVPSVMSVSAERPCDALERGYGLLFTSAAIDDAAEAFEEELRWLVRVADKDARIRRVGGEIQRTARQVNALRHTIVPRLASEARRIEASLEEQEREDHTRLKHLKRARSGVLNRPGVV